MTINLLSICRFMGSINTMALKEIQLLLFLIPKVQHGHQMAAKIPNIIILCLYILMHYA